MVQATCLNRFPVSGCIALSIAALLTVCVGFAADPTGTISGIVTDPSGSAVLRAQVTVKQTSTGLTGSVTTEAQGAFLFPLMPLGRYELSVEMKGFRRFEQRGITLLVNGAANIPVTLQLGTLTGLKSWRRSARARSCWPAP